VKLSVVKPPPTHKEEDGSTFSPVVALIKNEEIRDRYKRPQLLSELQGNPGNGRTIRLLLRLVNNFYGDACGET